MNNFLFSDALSDLIIHILVDCYSNFGSNETGEVGNILLVSMILCLMLKMSLSQNSESRLDKTIDLIFGIREDFGHNNVMTLLVMLKNKIANDILGSIVDYLIDLSKIPLDYFTDLSENPSDMITKSKKCLDIVSKNLQNKYQKIVKNNKKKLSDQKDLNG
ncbi:hypothetical protein RF11_08131 [Thelohanellus kitauei]|uniref:Uncharacterized protein n=1 Tax=Thelohanellus kitauei TaxID=669202 RepID=A0A0C2MHD3_THEKT|nr:hypothetical protein RF11_08131 [Thelohanellus kitauei]